MNPPPASGTIRTASASNLTIDGAHANGATGDYWNGSNKSIPTRQIIYEPHYNEYDNAPETVLELGAVYNRVDDTTIATGDRGVIDGRTLSLTSVSGEYRHTGVDRTLVDLTPSSTETRTVTVTDRENPITLTLPTDLDESEWESLLESEYDPDGDEDNDRYVTDYSCTSEAPGSCGELTVTLQPDATYELHLAQVGVGHSSVAQTPTYLTDVVGTRRVSVREPSNDSSLKPETNSTIRLAASRSPPMSSPVRVRFEHPISARIPTAGRPSFMTHPRLSTV
ncbi:hypothetical protein [Natronorubrum bangense]|uniref:hypothetical protein n=1 Tax=Natronorubrum bangense TaxID=61858 RepID=UPI001F0E2145|nr:hypothetical protein [Natronorubrum bangense]